MLESHWISLDRKSNRLDSLSEAWEETADELWSVEDLLDKVDLLIKYGRRSI